MEELSLEQMQLFGAVIQDSYEKNPPDTEKWREALLGCAELFRIAADHLEFDDPQFDEVARIIGISVRTGAEVQHNATMAFVMSGQAGDKFLENVRKQFREQEDARKQFGEQEPKE